MPPPASTCMDGPHMLANACFLYPHHLLCHYIREITLETAFVKILMATVVISTILLMIDGRWAGGALAKRIPTHRTLVPTRSSPSDCVGSAGRAPAVSGGGEYRITAYMPVCDRAHCVGGLGRACDAFSRCKGRGACRDAASLGHLAGQLLPTSQVRLLLLWAGCMQRKWDVLMRRWLRWRRLFRTCMPR